MSEFHRMITYLYLYEGNHKTRNTGFAKIEKRDSTCLIEIHMKNTGYSQKDLPVYFYTQKGNQFPGILLGNFSLTRGSGDFKKTLDSENLCGSGFSLSDIKGIFLPLSEQTMFLSQWDDDTFIRPAFSDCTAPPEEILPSKATAAHEPSPPQESQPVPNLQAAEAAPIPEEAADTPPPDSEHWERKWPFLLENYPVMTPFEGNDNIIGIRLELKDLRLLPKNFWYLGNNSFLLHGFFNYRHLLLGRKKDNDKTQWFLGIPGVFQNPERVMAALFGFPEFKGQKNSTEKDGTFGYWLRLLEL